MAGENLLETIRARMGSLPRREAAVAALALADPEGFLRMPLTAMAVGAGVSQPTVIRFCRSVDCAGVRDFKLRLAQCLGRGTPYVHASVEPGDDVSAYAAKVIDATAAAIAEARRGLDTGTIGQAVGLLAGARQIVFFGMGGSGFVVQDALHKFIRLDRPANAYTDPLMARMAVAALGPRDVVVPISNTGRTRMVIEVAALAREGGATVLALTAPGSPLAAAADVAVTVEPAEDAELYTPMASRIVHLMLLDVLVTGVALAKGTNFQERSRRIKHSLAPTRLPRQRER